MDNVEKLLEREFVKKLRGPIPSGVHGMSSIIADEVEVNEDGRSVVTTEYRTYLEP